MNNNDGFNPTSEAEKHAAALDIVSEALTLLPSQYEEFVSSRCEGDAALERLVFRILEKNAAPDILLTQDQATPKFESNIPDQVGPYRILEEIGQGGMGVVYRADRSDGSFEKTVAVKFLGGHRRSEEALARFNNERRIAARLIHPNIAQLLDGGSENGHPYIVMEYIDGKALNFQKDRPLNLQLALFCEICDAVFYAHSNLILHRDIKPANILIAADGRPKLLDFGIAKCQDSADEDALTQGVRAPMTPAYSAPEVLAGKPANVQSEVYSLGVLLYEMLLDERPYDLTGKRHIEAYQFVSSQSPPAVETGNSDLDSVISQAMHFDPERRYATVQDFRNDISCVINGEAISARRHERAYLLRKFIQRNKYAVLFASFALISLVAGLVGTTFGLIEAEEQRIVAEGERETAEEAVNFLTQLLSDSHPYRINTKEPTLSQLLELAQRNLDEGAVSDVAAQAAVETSLSFVYNGRGDYERSLQLVDKAIERLKSEGVSGPVLTRAITTRGIVLISFDKLDDAENVFKGVIEEYAAGENHLMHASAVMNLADVYYRKARYDEAGAEFNKALGILQQHGVEDQKLYAVALSGIAVIAQHASDYEKAIEYYLRSMDYLAAKVPDRAVVLTNIAGMYFDQKQYALSEKYFQQALALFEKTVGIADRQAVMAMTTMSNMYVQWGKTVAAREKIDHALRLVKGDASLEDFIHAYILNVAASAYCYAPYDQKGLTFARQALDLRRTFLPEGHWLLDSGLATRGFCQMQGGNMIEASKDLNAAYAALLEKQGPERPIVKKVKAWVDQLPAR